MLSKLPQFPPSCLVKLLPLVLGLALPACFDKADRWISPPDGGHLVSNCQVGTTRCSGDKLLECQPGNLWQEQQDCAATSEVCVAGLGQCTLCAPGTGRCDDQTPFRCSDDGSEWIEKTACDPTEGRLCRGGSCANLCAEARSHRSNVGCEYWAADLDNAVISPTLNAAEQQYAIVISNPQTQVEVDVQIYQDDGIPGDDGKPVLLAHEQIGPLSLKVFPLGPREVDGSPPGEYNTGTHTALTRAAYRISASFPVVAYQFNPLDNVNVFSNDASLLKPVEALIDDGAALRTNYVVLGWPQTIASTDNPATNFSVDDDSELRGFLTIIGTRTNTRVQVTPTARTLGAPLVPETQPGEVLELTLDPFDTLNLETGDFNADLTGSLIAADKPIVVFSGSEASDAPAFKDLSERGCCADHLEEQLDHIRTAGRRFVAAVGANRSLALKQAGANIGVVATEEIFRVIATSESGARVLTTLSGDDREFTLEKQGDYREILSTRDFLLQSDGPVMLAQISPSQDNAGVPRKLPGGDPSLLIVPPVEQFRDDYVFLTPAAYAFDFIRIIAPPDAKVVLDGQSIQDIDGCSNKNPEGLVVNLRPDDQEEFTVYRCQLSFPIIDNSAEAEQLLLDGAQDDGVHQILSDADVGVLVDGFDRNVSYAYAAGTELLQIVAR